MRRGFWDPSQGRLLDRMRAFTYRMFVETPQCTRVHTHSLTHSNAHISPGDYSSVSSERVRHECYTTVSFNKLQALEEEKKMRGRL